MDRTTRSWDLPRAGRTISRGRRRRHSSARGWLGGMPLQLDHGASNQEYEKQKTGTAPSSRRARHGRTQGGTFWFETGVYSQLGRLIANLEREAGADGTCPTAVVVSRRDLSRRGVRGPTVAALIPAAGRSGLHSSRRLPPRMLRASSHRRRRHTSPILLRPSPGCTAASPAASPCRIGQ